MRLTERNTVAEVPLTGLSSEDVRLLKEKYNGFVQQHGTNKPTRATTLTTSQTHGHRLTPLAHDPNQSEADVLFAGMANVLLHVAWHLL
jgi:hypothetical protein